MLTVDLKAKCDIIKEMEESNRNMQELLKKVKMKFAIIYNL